MPASQGSRRVRGRSGRGRTGSRRTPRRPTRPTVPPWCARGPGGTAGRARRPARPSRAGRGPGAPPRPVPAPLPGRPARYGAAYRGSSPPAAHRVRPSCFARASGRSRGLRREVHGEGRQAPRVAIQRGHREGADGAGVEPTGKQAAQRDVGHQLLGHCLAEQLAGAFGAVLGALFVTFRAQRPADQLAHTIAVEAQRLARPDLAQALVQAVAGSRRGGQGEQLGDAAGVEHRVGLGVGEDRLGFRGEQHASGGRVVVQRLDPEAIAHQPQALLALVPQGEAVDAAEAGEGSLAPLQIGAQHHFGVRAGAEDLAQRLQLGAQLAEVVDLAAVGQRHPPASLGKHRLGAVLQVDDRQAPMAEQRVPRQPQAFGVRPARGQGTGHAFKDAALLAEVAAPVGPAGDSTHG